ncbi:MAG: hypothetical protein MZW92_37765 [Comamonadaceae bacterium]|nr:hypothetical protein [Comamonadaceae bacterium]
MLRKSNRLATAYAMRRDLTALWARSNATREQLVKQLQDWCARAPKRAASRSCRTSRCGCAVTPCDPPPTIAEGGRSAFRNVRTIWTKKPADGGLLHF